MRRARWQAELTPGDPWHNMAKDAALLEEMAVLPALPPIVRVYQWDRAAVSIGRLQDEEPVHRRHPGLICVRRPTGGRAVVHGQDLTVTIAVHSGWLPESMGATVQESYQCLLAGVVDALGRTGRRVCFGSRRAREGRGVVDCFDLAVSGDLVDAVTGQKLLGSAQRRLGGAILQQMSLPLAVTGDRAMFVTLLQQSFQETLGIEEWLCVDTADGV